MWNKIVGMEVAALRGYKGDLDFILFSDKETYIALTEQSPYDYHDCAASARILDLHKNAENWQKMYNLEGYSEVVNPTTPF